MEGTKGIISTSTINPKRVTNLLFRRFITYQESNIMGDQSHMLFNFVSSVRVRDDNGSLSFSNDSFVLVKKKEFVD